MRRGRRIFAICTAVLLILSTIISQPIPIEATAEPSVDFNVTPDANELTLNADSIAEGNLNISLTPQGSVSQLEREAIDVAFVYDTSGSMADPFSNSDYKKRGKMKSEIAKNALKNALNYFEDNNVSDDNFYFIPFSDEVGNVVKGLDKIKATINGNIPSKGGTNYTQTLEEAQTLLQKSPNKNKYIIFLTDGEPSHLIYKRSEYEIYTNGTAKYDGYTAWWNYKRTKDLIHEKALQTSDELANSAITLYSIAFAEEDEIDFKLLQNMSNKTGGYAELANSDNLTSIFEQMSKKIDSYSISGEVTIDLKEVYGKVTMSPTANATIDDNKIVHVPFQFNFPEGQKPDPEKLEVTLPLTFTEEDLYKFDMIQLSYNGQTKQHPTIEINVIKNEDTIPGATFTARPSATEFIKPPNANAVGNIDISITPKGKAPTTSENRLPIDVVFVHDTSGSMVDEFDGARKDTTAKQALQGALNKFKDNGEDRFYFVPFDNKVSNKNIEENIMGTCYFLGFPYSCVKDKKLIGTVGKTVGLQNIKNMIEHIDRVSTGGTNYNAALTEAVNMISDIENRNKYIIFLTDGEPSVLIENNKYFVLASDGKQAIYNGSSLNSGWSTKNYNETKEKIITNVKDVSTQIGNQGITMYSIGFAPEGDVDFKLLQDMSARTGGYAVKGNTDNLSTLFDEIAEKVEMTTISGNVSVDLKNFNNVIVDPASNFKLNEQNKVQIPFNISFPAGSEPDPQLIQQSLPLQFKSAGTYNFKDRIVMTYTDLDGNSQTVPGNEFEVIVTDSTAPKFTSEVDVLGNQFHSPDSLIKVRDTDSEKNEFTVKYKLSPETVLTDKSNGRINSIKIVQPLFEGISLANSNQLKLMVDGVDKTNQASVKLINGGRDVEISLGPTEITYTKQGFSVEDFTIELKLKADWAIPYTKMPQANMYFNDNIFGEKSQSLNADDQRISMRVSLPGNNNGFTYYGDYTGAITKVNNLTKEVVAKTLLTIGTSEIQKNIKGLELVNDGTAIEVTYKDDTTALLYIKTDYILRNLAIKTNLQSGDETIGRVGFKISNLVLGDDVIYQYQYVNKGNTTEWAEFDPSAMIELPQELEGEIEIRVRTIGGFSVTNEPVVKQIKIVKEEIIISPDPIELNVGESVDLTVTLTPGDKTVAPEGIAITDSTIAKLENGKIIGLEDGETTIVVTTTDINGAELRAVFPIKVNAILITSLTVVPNPNPLSIRKHEEFSDFIIDIEPSNATNKNLKWESHDPLIVSILGGPTHLFNGPATIRGQSTGTTEIEISTTDGSDIRTTITVNVGSPLTGIEVPNEVVIEKGAVGENVNDYIKYLPSDASNRKGEPTFTLENDYILEVEPDGEMIPKRIGETVIEISVQDESENTFKADMKVKVVEQGSKDKNNQGDKY